MSVIGTKACPGLRPGMDVCRHVRGSRSPRRGPSSPPPTSSFSRKRESRGEGWHQPHPNTPSNQASFSYLGAPPRAGMSDWYENRSPLSSFVRKSALQSTSMPALHRRNVPNCRPMVDGGMRKCSAVEDFARRGACPPLGSGWGVAESAAPIRCTKPQFRLFTPWCAGAKRHERLL